VLTRSGIGKKHHLTRTNGKGNAAEEEEENGGEGKNMSRFLHRLKQ
jgi:hypothetical protein